MNTIDIMNDLEMAKLHSKIKEDIFENIRKHELFGSVSLWQSYMVRDFKNSYPKALRNQIDLVIETLISQQLLEPNAHGYKLTFQGEEKVYESDYYTADKVINTILVHLREKNYYKDMRWPRLTALGFCNSLIVYEKRLFGAAINKMIIERLLDIDDQNNAYIITEKCQNKMFGME